ncbi:MAG: homocysteine S-methyltransferase [Flavobacteriaceae bacterium]
MTLKTPLVLDGGLSNVLEARGWDLNHKLWTARLIEEHPEALVQAHKDYINAGAEIISSASYQATLPGLIELGLSKEKARDLILKSIDLVTKAVQEAKPPQEIKIAASIGPYGAYLADGSEYRGNYGVSDQELRDFHLEKIQILDASPADLLALETVPSYQEALVLSEILKEAKTPSWISFSCKDGEHLNDGTPIEELAKLFGGHEKVFALGINCTKPEYISGLISRMKPFIQDKQIIVYPNSGEAYNATSKTWIGISNPEDFATMTREWSNLGADIIGGCCRIGPEQIEKIRHGQAD